MRARDFVPPIEALALAPITLAQLGLPSQAFWIQYQPALVGAVATLVATSATGLGGSIAANVNATRIARFNKDVEVRLAALSFAVAETADVDFSTIGSHAFLARGVTPRARLVRVGGVRVAGQPTLFDPHWRAGKGVVGLSFSLGQFIAIDWGKWAQGKASDGRESWKRLTAEDRFRLNWGEMQLTLDYQSVLAHPVFDARGATIGALTVDGPTSLLAARASIEKLMRGAAGSIASVCPPPKGWWVSHG